MARPSKPEDQKLSKTVAWRVTESVHADLLRQYQESGLTQSEFLRELLERRKATIVARPTPSKDKRRLLYLFNKTSNNINQVAHRANADHLAGKVSEETYRSILASLEALSAALHAGVEDAD